MRFIALRMLTADRSKYLGLIFATPWTPRVAVSAISLYKALGGGTIQ